MIGRLKKQPLRYVDMVTQSNRLEHKTSPQPNPTQAEASRTHNSSRRQEGEAGEAVALAEEKTHVGLEALATRYAATPC